jgi:hypothetical protein
MRHLLLLILLFSNGWFSHVLVMVLDCCRNKPLLLNNPALIPYLVDALLLDPSHPRAEMASEQKAWCQMTHAE